MSRTISATAQASINAPETAEIWLILLTIDWTTDVDAWVANTPYAINDTVKPTGGGLIFDATTAGTSGTNEPSWAATIDGTTTDNDITWEAVGPIQLVNDDESVTSNSNVFIPMPFEFSLPGSRTDQIPKVEISIDNVDKRIVNAVRSITESPVMKVEVILKGSPDTVEATFDNLKIEQVRYNALKVTGSLVHEDIWNESVPQHSYTPDLFPGLF